MKTVAITGGTGLIGRSIANELNARGYKVVLLSRQASKTPESYEIRGYEPGVLGDVSVLINLAGDNLADGRWNQSKKDRILGSRTTTIHWISEQLENGSHSITRIISASAIGYYGTFTSDKIFSESDPPGSDFLAGVCQKWESAVESLERFSIPVVRIRIGVVLSRQGGALPKLLLPLKFGFTAPIGSGHQWIPWVHIQDLARMFSFMVDNQQHTGAYNAVAPEPVTNRMMMKILANHLKGFYLPMAVPGFFLKWMMGEKSIITLHGSRVSSQKIVSEGFSFTYPVLDAALRDLLKK